MKSKTFGATSFFAVIVALLVAFTAYDYWSKEKQDQKKDEDSKVVQFRKADLNEIEMILQHETHLFVKKDDIWRILKPIQETADQQSVLNTIDSLYAEKIADTVKEEKGKGEFPVESYGLNHPLLSLKLRAGTASQDLKIGSVKAFDGSLYGQINDQKKVVLLSSAWAMILTKPINDFRDKRLFRGDAKAEFDSAVVDARTPTGASHFELTRADDDDWILKSQRPTDAIDKDNVERWITQIKALRGADFVASGAVSEGQLARQSDRTITLSKKGQPSFVLKLARDKKNFDAFEATSSDVPSKPQVWLSLAKDATDALLLGPEAFFNRKSPFKFDATDVARVIFHDAKTGKKFDTTVDPAKPDMMVAKLQALEAVRFLGPIAQNQLEKKFSSSLRLLKSDGSLVFEMSWGEPVTENATSERPEAVYLPIKTNLSKQVVGLAEKSVAELSESETAPAKEK